MTCPRRAFRIQKHAGAGTERPVPAVLKIRRNRAVDRCTVPLGERGRGGVDRVDLNLPCMDTRAREGATSESAPGTTQFPVLSGFTTKAPNMRAVDHSVTVHAVRTKQEQTSRHSVRV